MNPLSDDISVIDDLNTNVDDFLTDNPSLIEEEVFTNDVPRADNISSLTKINEFSNELDLNTFPTNVSFHELPFLKNKYDESSNDTNGCELYMNHESRKDINIACLLKKLEQSMRRSAVSRSEIIRQEQSFSIVSLNQCKESIDRVSLCGKRKGLSFINELEESRKKFCRYGALCA